MKNLRRVARNRIRADEALTRQHWTATGGWKQRIVRILAWYLLLPGSTIVIGALVAFLGVVLGSGNFAPRQVDAYPLVIAGISAIVAFAHAYWVLRELIISRSLAVVSVFPDSDRRFAKGRIKQSLLKTLLFLAAALLLGGGVAYGAELNLVETVLVPALSVLLWLMVASLSVILAAYFPILARQETISTLPVFVMLPIFVGVGFDFWGVAGQATLIFSAMAVLPTGWPILMIRHAVILKQPEFWQFLIPATGVLVLAVFSWFRLLSRYRVDEFSYEFGATAVAIFPPSESTRATASDEETIAAAAVDNPESTGSTEAVGKVQHPETTVWLRDRRRWLRAWLKLPTLDEGTEELSPEQAKTLIRESRLTGRFDWQESSFIERTMSKILGDEELLTAEILTRGEPKWSASVMRSLAPAAAVVMLVVIVGMLFGRKIVMISGHVALGGVIGTLAGTRVATFWRASNGDTCSALAALPLDARRVFRMMMTLGAVRSLLIFPLAIGVVMAIIWGSDGRIEILDSAIFGAKIALIFFMIHQWWFLIMQPYIQKRSIVGSVLDILIVLCVVGVLITGIVLLLSSGRDELWSTVGGGLAFGSGWVALAMQRRRILNAPTDFVVQMQVQQKATIQRQQESKRTSMIPTLWPKPVDLPEPLS